MNLSDIKAQGFIIGPYGLQGGVPPKSGSGRRTAPFTPPSTASSYSALAGTPYMHSSQQHLALWHAVDEVGFDDDTITFLVNWLWMEPSDITVTVCDGQIVGWNQEEGSLL